MFGFVASTDKKMDFFIHDNQHVMSLSGGNLGLFTQHPAANLHVLGNAMINDQLTIGASDFSSSNLYIAGTISVNPQIVSSNVTGINASVILADTGSSGGNIDILLPYAGNVSGREVTIKKTNNLHAVRVQHGGLIDGIYTHVSMSSTQNSYPVLNLVAAGNVYYILNKDEISSLEFDLTQISNCVVWLDASDGTALSKDGSGNVTAWPDKSGRANNFTQSSNTKHPAIQNNWKNGLDAVAFDPNTQEYLRSSSNLTYSDEGMTFFIVLENETSSTDGNASVFTIHGINNPTLWIVTKNDGVIKMGNQHSGDAYTSAAIASTQSTPMIVYGWFDFDSQKKYIKQDGGNESLVTGIQFPLISESNDAWVGTQKINLEDRSFGGNVGEIIVYDRKLADEEISKINNYLKAKWDL